MADLQYVGPHEPIGLQYLKSEGFLAADAGNKDYKWQQQLYVDENDVVRTEEVLRVDHCVIWSRNGSIKRVYNLDIEGEAISHAFTTAFPVNSVTEGNERLPASRTRTTEAALVVVLKTQAHIFCLSGEIHIIPLSFQVARALPCPFGCILQPASSSSRVLQPAPDRKSHSNWQNATCKPSLASDLFSNITSSTASSTIQRKLPTYCISDVFSEIGVVAASPSRKLRSLDECLLLPSNAELLFVSSGGRLFQGLVEDVCIAVSFERTTSEVTIWQVIDTTTHAPQRKGNDKSAYRNRQSSNIYEQSAVSRARQPSELYREPVGGLLQSFVDENPKAHSSQLSNIEHLAAELGQNFETAGVQTRSARRISSMLARTDLAQANDRSAYNETNAASRKSISRTLRKEGSIGSFNERRSFGGRKSFQAGGSMYSQATSFLDPASRLSFGDSVGPGFGEVEDAVNSGAHEKSLAMLKLKSFRTEDDNNNPDGEFKVMLIPHPTGVHNAGSIQHQFSVCILEIRSRTMTVATIGVIYSGVKMAAKQHSAPPELKTLQVQKGTNIVDALTCSDGPVTRLIVLSRTSQGDDVLHLESPWSSLFRLTLHDRRKALRECKITSFKSTSSLGKIVFEDQAGHTHELRLRMHPRQTLIWQVIQLCRCIWPSHLQDSMLVAYWEIEAWLKLQEQQALPKTVLAIMLFSLAVPSINIVHSKPSTPGRRRKGHDSILSQHSSTALMHMRNDQKSRGSPAWSESSAWTWTSVEPTAIENYIPTAQTSPNKLRLSSSDSLEFWLLKCLDLTRDFLQSPAGETLSGTEGYLPTAINQEWNLRRTALATVVVALYLLGEELSLASYYPSSTLNDRTTLAALTAQLSSWLGWQSWAQYMQSKLVTASRDQESFMLDKSVIDGLKIPSEPFLPTTLFRHLVGKLHNQAEKYHTLVGLVHSGDDLPPDHPLVLESARLLPMTSAVLAVKDESKDGHLSTLLPHVVSRLYRIGKVVERDSVGLSVSDPKVQRPKAADHVFTNSQMPHVSLRDIHVMCNQALDAEGLGKWDTTSEVDRQTVTKLIFSHDRRFQEATKLVNQSRPPEVEYDPQPDWSEADALEAQKLLAQYATRRTFAVVSGRGLMYFNARTPLLTETVPRAQFSMQCVLRSKSDAEGGQSMTFSADRTMFTEEKVSWAFFHNGASNGLMISRQAQFVDTSWILYNKPHDLNNRHAGFLLALGLNGHLKTLAKWVAFKYLTPKHTMTSIGLLLGLAVSYKGSADTLITRLLSVHATCMLPPGAAELNLSPLIQTTSLVGIGLLYYNTQHRRMSDVMMNEIESQQPEEETGDDAILRNEGYRLAAGMALGLINLGQGLKLHSLHDMGVVERLLTIAVGTKNVHLVHVLDRATAGAVIAIALIFLKTNNSSVADKIDIPDTQNQFDYVRPDVFLVRTLARHLIMWDRIQPRQEFVNGSLPKHHRHHADLRAIKRLSTNDLPFFHVVAGVCFSISLKYAGSLRADARDLLLQYLDQFMRLSRLPSLNYDANVTLSGIRNCLDILALACATVMAGTGDLEVYRRLRALHGRIDKDTPYGSHLSAHMAVGALFLSGGMATFNTSDLAIASLVMSFYPLFPTDVLDNRAHLQALRHLWVLAVQHRCLVLRDADTHQALGDIEAELTMQDGTKQVVRTPGLLPPLSGISSITVVAEGFWPERQGLDDHIGEKDTSTAPRARRNVYGDAVSEITILLRRRAPYDQPDIDPFEAEMQALTLHDGITTAKLHSATADSLPINLNPVDWVFEQQAFGNLGHDERELAIQDRRGPHGPSSGMCPVDTRLELDLGTLGPDRINPDMRKPVQRHKLWQVRILFSWADSIEDNNDDIDAGVRRADRTTEDTEQVWLKKDVVEMLRWKAFSINKDMTEPVPMP